MTYRMTDDDLRNAEQAARKFQGTWWQGTSGTLAAWVLLLLKERQVTVDEMNATLRQAVEARYAQQPGGLDLPDSLADYTLTPAEPLPEATFCDPEPVTQMAPEQLEAAWAGVKAKQADLHARLRDPAAAEPIKRRTADIDVQENHGAQPLRPGSVEFVAVLDEIRRLHLAKTLDYGVDEDALSNIRTSAAVVGMPPWSGAVLRIADKMHRLQAFHRRGRVEFDGVQDTLLDIASYAVIALVLYREATCTEVQ